MVAHAIAQVALQLDALFARCAAGAADSLQLLCQLLEERGVARQAVDNRHRLAATPFLLHPQLRGERAWNRLIACEPAAALAVVCRPAAGWADASRACRIDRPGVPIVHRV